MEMKAILDSAVKHGASDVIICAGTPPKFRVGGDLHPLKLPAMSPEETKALVYSVLSEEQIAEFEERLELDLSIAFEMASRDSIVYFPMRDSILKQHDVDTAWVNGITRELGDDPERLQALEDRIEQEMSHVLASALAEVAS